MNSRRISARVLDSRRTIFSNPTIRVRLPTILLVDNINKDLRRLYAGQSFRSPSNEFHVYISQATQTSAIASKHPTKTREDDTSRDELERFDARYATEVLFKECARQADYVIPQAFERSGVIPKNKDGEDVGEGVGCWYQDMVIMPTFANWSQITMLYMYLLTVRLRYLPPEHAERWLQLLHDHFFHEAEHRMSLYHGITSRMARNRHLKDLYNQWRGVLGAYDEGLVKGDAVLGTAIWRNIFKADTNVNWATVALIVSFVRRSLRGLDKVQDKTILTASLQFGDPTQELHIVQRLSEGITEDF